MSTAIFELQNIQKTFGGVPALRGARFEIRPGEIHALVGENGAGKSTLINIATGLFKPDSGQILFNGAPLSLSNTREAAAAGIAVVHQEADLFAQLTLAENMLLGRGLVRHASGFINWPATNREAQRLVSAFLAGESVGESLNVREEAGTLSVARRMMAEIASAVYQKADGGNTIKVLFLDEPTASLTQKEIDNLFQQIRRLRAAGVGIVYVSHRLEEILELCDRVTVMRDGATIETRPVEGLTIDQIVAAMVGREVTHGAIQRESKIGATRLCVKNATSASAAFNNISFDVKAGEIVGVYGFVGAGRSELAQALFGLHPMASGAVTVDNEAVQITSPRDALNKDLAYLPEDRLVQGIFKTHSLRANASVSALRNLSAMTLIRSKDELALANRTVNEMRVRASSIEQPIGTLSGGNQQKVVFGRWQSMNPKVLMLDEPTRGVDVGAKAEIHKLIADMAANGAAVLLISSELPEIMAISDRVIVLSEGRQTGEFVPNVDGEQSIAAAAVPKALPVSPDSAHAASKISPLARILQFREFGLMTFIMVLSAAMAFLKPDKFATGQNILGILADAAIPAIMAQGAMLIICAGGIDISVGSMLGLIAAAAALAAKAGMPPLIVLLLAIGMGILLSLANASTSLIARIHPIIVTLAGLSIYQGLMRIVSGGSEVSQLPVAYRALVDGNLFSLPNNLGFPKICAYVLVITLLTHLFLRYTLAGRRVLAMGNSENAARLIGLSKARVMLLVFGISGALVGLSSVLMPAYYGIVQSNTGEGMEFKAIAAAVIGGTNILGGRGSAFGALLGAFLIALLYNMLVLLEASSYWQNIFVGGLILAAVVADALLNRVRTARKKRGQS